MQRSGLKTALAGTEEKPAAILTGPAKEITAVAFDPIGQFAVAGSKDNKLFSWDLYDGKFHSDGKTAGQIRYFAFSPDGQHLVTVAGQGNLIRRVPSTWEKSDWPKQPEEDAHQGVVLGLAFADEESFFSVGVDGTLRRWKVADGALLEKWKLPEHPAQADMHLPTRRLVALNAGGLVKVWDFSKPKVETFKSFEKLGKFTRVRFLAGGDELLLVTADQRIEILQISTGTLVRPFKPVKAQMEHSGAIRTLAVSPDEKLIATGDETGRILVWNPETGDPVAMLKGRSKAVTALAFDPEGKRLLSGDADEKENTGAVYVWDMVAPETPAPSGPQDTGAAHPSPRELAKGDEEAGPAARPSAAAVPLPEVQLLDSLLAYVVEHPDCTVCLNEGLKHRSHPERLGEAMIGSQDIKDWPPRVARAVQAAQDFAGEIHLVSETDVPGFSGVFYDPGEGPKTETLYFGRRLLKEAPPIMIRDAIERPQTALGPLEEFSAELQKRPVVKPHPSPGSKTSKSASTSRSTQPTPSSRSTQPTLSGTTALSGTTTISGTVTGSQSAPASVAATPSVTVTTIASAPTSTPGVKPEGGLDLVQVLKQIQDVRRMGRQRQAPKNTMVIGTEIFDSGKVTVTADASESAAFYYSTEMHKASNRYVTIPPPGFERAGRRGGAASRRYRAVVPSSRKEAEEQVANEMGEEWKGAVRALDRLLKDKRNRISNGFLDPRTKLYLFDLMEKMRNVLTLADSEGATASERLAALLKDAAPAEEAVRLVEKADPEERRMMWAVEAAREKLTAAKQGESVPGPVLKEALGQLLGAATSSSWVWQRVAEYGEKAGSVPTVPWETVEKLLNWVAYSFGIHQVMEGSRTVPMEMIPKIHDDAYRLARLSEIASLSEKLTGPGFSEDMLREVLRVAEQVLDGEWESAFGRFIRSRAGSGSASSEANGSEVGAIGVLFIKPDGSVRRYVEGGGATFISNSFSPVYFSFQIQEWYQPGDRVVLLYDSDTGYPNLAEAVNFWNDTLLLQEVLHEHPEIWMGTVDSKGLRLFKPSASPADFPAWCAACQQTQELFNRYEQVQELLTDDLFSVKWKGTLGGAPTEDMKRAAWLSRMQAVETALEKRLRDGYGGDADQVLTGIRGLFGDRLARFRKSVEKEPKGNDWTKALYTTFPLLVHDTVRMGAEWAAAPLVGQGKPLQQVHLQGVSLSDPPRWPGGEPAPAGPRTSDADKIRQELLRVRDLADRGMMLPNTLVVGFDPAKPGVATLAFDTSDSKPDSFENIQLFPDAGVVLIVPDPKRWMGRTRLKGSRFIVYLPDTFAEAKELAKPVMVKEWGGKMDLLDDKLEEERKKKTAPDATKRAYLKDLLDLQEGILSLRDAQGLDARGRLEQQVKEPSKVDTLVDVFEQMDRRMVTFYRESAQVLLRSEKGTEPVEASQVRETVGRLIAAMPEGSPSRRAAQEYMDRLGTEPVDRAAFLVFLQQVQLSMSIEQVPLLARVVPMGQLSTLYHDALRLARLRQIAEYRNLLPESGTLPEDLMDRILLTANQVYLLEWENAFYGYVLINAESPTGQEKVTGFKQTGLGLLLLRPDGSVRRFVPGGGAASRPPTGQSAPSSYYNLRFAQWRQPGDRGVFLVRSDSGYPDLMHIRAFLDDWAQFQQQPDPPEVLLGTVTKEGTIRVFRLNLPPGDLNRWSEASARVEAAAEPYARLYDDSHRALHDDSSWKGTVKRRSMLAGIARKVPDADADAHAYKVAFYQDLPNRFQAFLDVMKPVANLAYGTEKGPGVMRYLENRLRGILDDVLNAQQPIERKIEWIAGPARVRLLALGNDVAHTWAERPVADWVGEGRLLQAVGIPGLTDPSPPSLELIAEHDDETSSPAGTNSEYEAIAGAMRYSAKRALRGEWGTSRLGVAYEEMGHRRIKVSVDLHPSVEIGFPFVMMPGKPPRPVLVPLPSQVTGNKAVPESGRYTVSVDRKAVVQEMRETPGLGALAHQDETKIDSLVRAGSAAQSDWIQEVTPALREVLERRDGKRGTAKERLETARQRLGAVEVDGILAAIRKLYEQERDLRLLVLQAQREVSALPKEQRITSEELTRIFEPLLGALAPWPRLQNILASFLEITRAKDGEMPEPTLNILKGTPIAVHQQGLFLLTGQVSPKVLAAVYHDAFRSVFLDRLEQLEHQSGAEEVMDRRLNELHLMAQWVADVEEEAIVHDHMVEEARVPPPDWAGSHMPVGGAGILFLKDGRPVQFIPGAGMIVQERKTTVYYFNAPLDQMNPPGGRDTVVLLYPSLITGSPNAEQLQSFLEDWLALQSKTPSEIWMGTVTEGGTLRLFRPNLPAGDVRAWADLNNAVQKDDYESFETFVHQEVFSPVTLENLSPDQVAKALSPTIRLELQTQYGTVAEGVKRMKEGTLHKGQDAMEKWFRQMEDRRLDMLARGLAAKIREGLVKAFGQDEAERIWGLIQPRFQPEFDYLARLQLPEQQEHQLPFVAWRVLMAVGELKALPFVTDGQKFTQKEIVGFATGAPAAENPQESELPAAPAVAMPARAMEWTPAAASAPSLGEPVDPDGLRKRLRQIVSDLLDGKYPLDQRVVWQSDVEGAMTGVYVDISSTVGLEPVLQMAILPREAYFPVIPDPRQIKPGAAAYTAWWEKDKLLPRVEPVVRELEAVVPDDSDPQAFRTQASSQGLSLKLPAILQGLHGVLERADSHARNAEGRLRDLRESDPQKAAARLVAVQAVETLLDQQAYLAERIILLQRRFWRKSQEGGKVPVGDVRAAFNEWLPKLASLPRVEAGLQLYLQGLTDGGTVDPLELVDILEEGLDGIRHETPFVLNRAASGAALLEVYYDAFREAWRKHLLKLDDRFAREGTQEKTVAAILWAREQVVLLETEAVFTQLILDNARIPPKAAERLDASSPVAGAGVLLIDPKGQMRLAAGASGIKPPLQFQVEYLSDHLKPWVQEGDKIVLLYPSFTGVPNLQQLKSFHEDLFRLRRELPGHPEIWFGVGTPDGNLKLFRPDGIPPPPGDLQAWNRSYLAVMKRFEEAYIPVWKILAQEALPQRMEVGERLDLAQHFLARFQDWLVRSGVFNESGAQQIEQTLRAHLKKEVGSDLKALVAQYQAVADKESARKIRTEGDYSEAFFSASLTFSKGFTAVLAKSTMILLEQLAQPLMPLQGFTEVPIPGDKDPAEQLNEAAKRLADSATSSIKGLSRPSVEAAAREWIGRQGGPRAKFRPGDFLKHVREQKRSEENRRRKEAEDLAKIHEGVQAEYAADQAHWERHDQMWRDWAESLPDVPAAPTEPPPAAQELLPASPPSAAPSAALEPPPKPASAGLPPTRPALRENLGPVRDLAARPPRKPPPAPPALPLPLPPEVVKVTPPSPVDVETERTKAVAEIQRIEQRLETNLASPEADFNELLTELKTAGGISTGVLDAEWKGRLAGVRSMLGGAVSGRVFAEVDHTLTEAAQLTDRDEAKRRLDKILLPIQEASEALKGFPMFQGPLQRQLPVLETTQTAAGLMAVLISSDEDAKVEEALVQSRGIVLDRLHKSWQKPFREARQNAAQGLADGGRMGAEQAASDLLEQNSLFAPAAVQLLWDHSAYLERCEGYLKEVSADGDSQKETQSARQGVDQMKRLAQVDLENPAVVLQALEESKGRKEQLASPWDGHFQTGVSWVAGYMISQTDRGDLKALTHALALLHALGFVSQELQDAADRLQGPEWRRILLGQGHTTGVIDQALVDPAALTVLLGSADDKAKPGLAEAFVERIVADSDAAYQELLDAENPAVPAAAADTQSLKTRLAKAEEVLVQVGAAGKQSELAAAGFKVDLIKLYKEGKELEGILTYRDKKEVESFVEQVDMFLSGPEASHEPEGRKLMENQLVPGIVATFYGKLFEEISRVLEEQEPKTKWKELTGIRPLLDDSVAFLLKSSVYNVQDKNTIRRNQMFVQRSIEALSREKGIVDSAHGKSHQFNLRAGQVLRLVHRHSGRVVEIGFRGDVRQPTDVVKVAGLQMRVPPGLVAVGGGNLSLGQKHGDWRESRNLMSDMGQHRAMMENAAQPLQQGVELQAYPGKYGVSHTAWVFDIDDMDGFIADRSIVLSKDKPQGKDDVRLQDLYNDLEIRMDRIATDNSSVQVMVQDTADQYEKPQLLDATQAGAEEDDRAPRAWKDKPLTQNEQRAIEAVLPDLEQAIRDGTTRTVHVLRVQPDGSGAVVKVENGGRWLYGFLPSREVFFKSDVPASAGRDWLLQHVRMDIQAYVLEIRPSRTAIPDVIFTLREKEVPADLFMNQDLFETHIRNAPTHVIRGFLSSLQRRGVDPQEQILSLYNGTAWEQVSFGRRQEVIHWLAEHTHDSPRPADLLALFHEAAQSPKEEPVARLIAVQGMARILDPSDSGQRDSLIQTVQELWVASKGWSLRSLEMQRARLFGIGNLLKEPPAQWRRVIGIEPDWHLSEEGFQGELVGRRAPQAVTEFLDWLSQGGMDPQQWLTRYQQSEWDRLGPGQRAEAAIWLAGHVNRESSDRTFEFLNARLNSAVGTTAEWRETLRGAARGISNAAEFVSDRARAQTAVQSLLQRSVRIEDRELQRIIQGYLRQAEAKLGVSQTGLEEIPTQAQENTVLFLRADLFDPLGARQLDDLTLAGMAMQFREILGWPADRADLEIAVVSDENRAKYQRIYDGWRVLEIRRQAGSDPRPLPVAAIPRVVARALQGGKDLDLVVTPYLNLQGQTLEQEMQELAADLSA